MNALSQGIGNAEVNFSGFQVLGNIASYAGDGSIEMEYISNVAYIHCYRRVSAVFVPLEVAGTTIKLKSSTSDALEIDGSANAGDTRLLLYDVNKGALSRVTVGANDSGGSGYKLLRVPN